MSNATPNAQKNCTATAFKYQNKVTQNDWGFSILTESEIEAFQIAYLHRNSPFGVKVRFAGGAGKFQVTVFNELASTIGIDRS